MKSLTAALLATAFVASPALACGFGKSADYKMPTHTASMATQPEEAMSTFDPEAEPVFEEKTEANLEPVKEVTGSSESE